MGVSEATYLLTDISAMSNFFFEVLERTNRVRTFLEFHYSMQGWLAKIRVLLGPDSQIALQKTSVHLEEYEQDDFAQVHVHVRNRPVTMNLNPAVS